jgi:hypothetical protein
MTWQALEEKVKRLLKTDRAKTVPGSGNGKSEEDVIGISTISQCKYTERLNTSILAKDVERLVQAARLQEKLPLFFTESGGSFILSIPDNPLMSEIVNVIVTLALLDKITKELEDCNTIGQYNTLRRFVNDTIDKVIQTTDTSIKCRFLKIQEKLDILYDDLTTMDLFEDHH